MNRNHRFPISQLAVAAALALAASAAAADDSSMSVLTGDSYAFFNDLDYNPGRFNTARAPRAADRDVAKMPRKDRRDAAAPTLLAGRPLRGELRSPFRDDTGA